MEESPEPPDGYEQPQRYELPKWGMVIAGIVLSIPSLAVVVVLNPQLFIPDAPLSNAVMLIFAVVGSGYLHESVHYVVVDAVGYEPEFIWPNRVNFGVNVLQTGPTVASLLAPQVLTVLYVVLIVVGVAPALEAILVWSFILNLVGGVYDVSWAVRRLTWPRGTVVILSGGENFVAFPDS